MVGSTADQEKRRQEAIEKSALNLKQHILEKQELAQEHVETARMYEESLEESRKAARRHEIDLFWQCEGNSDMRESFEAREAPQKSLKALYKDIEMQINMLPKHLYPILGTVTTAIRIKNASIARNKKREVQVAFSNINKTISTINEKGNTILEKEGLDTVPQDFLTAFVEIRNSFSRIELGASHVMNLMEMKDDVNWLESLSRAMNDLKSYMVEVADAWKKVKLLE